jgi:hypothetical protein
MILYNQNHGDSITSRQVYADRNLKGQFLKGHNPVGKSGRKIGSIPWNKGKKGLQVAWNKGLKTGVKPWNKGTKGLQIAWNKGLKMPEVSIRQMGEKNPGWKGNNVGYSGVHKWIAKKYGYPKKCSLCFFEDDNQTKFDWANISHQYKRIESDWIRICKKCHKKYDYLFDFFVNYFLILS